jgi:hypothetical protein
MKNYRSIVASCGAVITLVLLAVGVYTLGTRNAPNSAIPVSSDNTAPQAATDTAAPVKASYGIPALLPGSQIGMGRADGSLIRSIEMNTAAINASVDELITEEYDADEFCGMMGFGKGGANINLNRISKELSSFNNYYPVECLRKIDDNFVYAVYKMHVEDKPFYAYFFFEKILEEGLEYWSCRIPFLTADKKLSSADFASIKVGSTYSDVLAISGLAKTLELKKQEPYWDEVYDLEKGTSTKVWVEPKPILQTSQMFVLTDGVLNISFQRSDENSTFLVSKVSFTQKQKFRLSPTENTETTLEIREDDFPSW